MRFTNGSRNGGSVGLPVGSQLFAGLTSDVVFGYSDAGEITRLRVDAAGVTATGSVAGGPFRGRIAAAGGRLYDSAGRAVDMATLTVAGTCTVTADVVAPDLENNRIFYVRSDAALVTLSVCTPTTGALRSREIPNFGSALGNLLDALYIGAGRLALVGSNGIVLLDPANL